MVWHWQLARARRRAQLAWLACLAVTVLVFEDFPPPAPPSDFGLPGIGFKPSFILSGRPPSVLARRMFWLEANFFPHAIRSPEEKGGLKRMREEWSRVQCRIVQEVQFGCNLVLASPSSIHPPAFHSAVSTLKQNEHHYFTAVRI